MEFRSKRLITLGLMVGLLVAALDQTIVDTAFPRMIAELHGEKIFTWVITIYLLASTAIVPVVGKLADIYGRKVFYLLGMALFVGGSLLCGAAQTMIQLIIFRGLQGVGGGMLMPIAFTIIGDLFPGEQRAKMQGLFGGVFGLASIFGPKLGGWITHHLSWRYIFYINLPIGLIAIALMLFFYQESKGERRPIDWLGSITVVAGVSLFLLALNRAETWGWSSWQTLGMLAAALVLLVLFVRIERRVEEPVLDLTLFQNRTFAIMSATGFLMGAGMFGAIVYLPYFIQGVVGVNPSEAGNVMTPMMVTMILFSVLAGRLATKVPYRYQVSAGFLVLGGGFLLMTRWTAETTQLEATLASMVLGAGMGLIMPIVTLAVQNAFPANRRGVVTSAATFFRSVGATVGVTGLGVVFNHEMSARFQEQMGSQVAQLQLVLAKLPPQAAQFFQEVQKDPQMLVRLLLSQEAQAQLPEAFRGPFIHGIKVLMAESLHTVFYTSIGVMVLGLLLAQLLGKVSLAHQARELQGDVVTRVSATEH